MGRNRFKDYYCSKWTSLRLLRLTQSLLELVNIPISLSRGIPMIQTEQLKRTSIKWNMKISTILPLVYTIIIPLGCRPNIICTLPFSRQFKLLQTTQVRLSEQNERGGVILHSHLACPACSRPNRTQLRQPATHMRWTATGVIVSRRRIWRLLLMMVIRWLFRSGRQGTLLFRPYGPATAHVVGEPAPRMPHYRHPINHFVGY